MTDTVTLASSTTTRWESYAVLDSITRATGFFEVTLYDGDAGATDVFEQYDAAVFTVNGTTILKGQIDEINPNDQGGLDIKGKNLMHELTGEFIIESYGISQVSSTSPMGGSDVVIDISDTTGFEVGDQIEVADGGATITADSFTLNKGEVESGDVTDTFTINATYLKIGERAGDGLSVDIDFNIGAGVVAQEVELEGRSVGGTGDHHVDFFAFNFDTNVYDKISEANNRMGPEDNDEDYIWVFDAEHTDTNGDVKTRLLHHEEGVSFNNAHDLFIDQIIVKRGVSAELAIINAVVTNTSVTVDTLIRDYENPILTVGRPGRFIVDDLLGKFGKGMTKNGIPATSPEKFIKLFKGITAFGALQEIADAERFQFGHDLTGDFFYQPANFEDSGITLTYGSSDILDVMIERVGSEVINRVDVYGKIVGGIQIAARSESIPSQDLFGVIKAELILEEDIETEAEAEALGDSILAEKAFAIQLGTLTVIGQEALRAGQLVTLAGVPGLTDGQYVVIEKEHRSPESITILRVAQFRVDFEDKMFNLIKRMREREKENLDENATLTKLLNFYEDTTSDDSIEVFQVNINDGYIAGHRTNGIIGRGFNGVGGTQLKAGRFHTETQII